MTQPKRSELPEYIQDRIEPEPMSGCWLWTGQQKANGYGAVYERPSVRGLVRGRPWVAHRLVFELLRRPLLVGEVLDHLCRTRLCVNPSHLRACTDRENILAPGSQCTARANFIKTACFRCQGPYELTPEGRRFCRPCRSNRQREYAKRRYWSNPEASREYHRAWRATR